PGLEDALLEELRAFKIKKPKVLQGGVEFQSTSRGLYQVLRQSRIVHRLYLRVDEFRARDGIELYNKTRRYEWERLISGGEEEERSKVHVRSVVHRSGIGGSGEAVDRVADGLRDHFSQELKIHPPDIIRTDRAFQRKKDEGSALTLMARVIEDRCELNLEMAGRALHQRGWRDETGAAPLRESLAAALLSLAGWSEEEPLIDPMCGSGTFVIEAARRRRNLEPRLWSPSDYGALSLVNANRESFDEAAVEPVVLEDAPPLIGADRDEDVLEKARRNAARAEILDDVTLLHREVADLVPAHDVPGLVICNPPYGERLERSGAIKELLEVFASGKMPGWRLGILLPRDFDLTTAVFPMEERARLTNGGLPVTFWIGTSNP
ncbi:MAG: hypothetical protein VX475_23600, partial [Myxococcota bacterium]|nr:hypothetical protein [Myxococcota bacterium]